MNESSKNNVNKETCRLISYLKLETPESKEVKAHFRHSAAMQPGEDVMLWGWLLSNLDPEMQGDGGNISFAEYAVYTTLSMFAIGPDNNKENSIAEAVALGEIKRSKLTDVETATDMKEMQTALRGLVKLITSKGVSFDYGRLASDLYYWQINKANIARKWEREYARKEKK